MGSVNVIVADKAQLVRLGITGILYQTGIPVRIKEAADPDKLLHYLKKGNKGLMIISRSFLTDFSKKIMGQSGGFTGEYMIVVINDVPAENYSIKPEVYEIIENTDSERVIYQKIEKALRTISNSAHPYHNTEEISQREKEVVKFVALGMTNKEIADRLYISLHTVITHRKNITAKLGIKTIAGLTIYAILNKLIHTEEIR